MSEHFDVAILGSQTSGLIAAALLAKRRRRVVLIDHGENVTSYRHKGVHFPLVPTLVPSLEDSPAIKQVHEELGVSPELRARVSVDATVFQAIMPNHRVDVKNKTEAFLDELRFEFPDLVGPVRLFFQRLFELDKEITEVLSELPALPPRGFFERRSAKKILARYPHLDEPFEDNALLADIPRDHPVRDLLLGPLTFFGHLNSPEPSTLHAVRLVARYYRGALTFEDRLGGLRALLEDTAKSAGVSFRRNSLISAITLDGRKIATITTEGDRPISADYVIANSLTSLDSLLPPGKVSAKVGLETQRIRATQSLLVCNLLIDRAVVPCGMAESLFLLNGRLRSRDEVPRDPPIFVRLYPARRNDRQNRLRDDDGQAVLSIGCPVSTRDATRSPEKFAALKTQMLARVRRLIPFLEDFTISTSVAADTKSWDLDNATVRTVDPWSFHPLYETDERPWLGVAMRENRGYLKNVVYTGRDVLPGLGLEGEYLVGIQAAETLVKMAKKKWQEGAS